MNVSATAGAAIERLRDHGLVVELLGVPSAGADLVARVDGGSRGSRTYTVEVKRRVTTELATAMPLPGILLCWS